MSFRLEADEPVAEGIKRIIREQIDQAIHNLVEPEIDRDEGIHEARKCFKRIRGALRLVRDEIGEEIYERENICFRDCGRLVAPARDSFVMVETVEALADDDDYQLPPAVLARIREKLLERYQLISQEVLYESRAVEEVAGRLRQARERILDLPIEQEGFAALNRGLRRVYRRGRQAMSKAYDEPQAKTFHEWRKRVKYLWHHIEILELLRPTLLGELAEELHQLSDYLGDDHDLAELRRILAENPALLNDEKALLALVALVDERRSQLEAAARPLGERIYSEKPKVFVERIAAYWEAWQDEQES